MSFKKSKKANLVDTLASAIKPPKKSHKKRNLLLGAVGLVGTIAAGSALTKEDHR